MKKTLTLIMLGALVLGARSQPFTPESFLNVQSLQITNSFPYTNTLSYLGINTNQVYGNLSNQFMNDINIQYTNNVGTWIVTATNAITQFFATSNGAGFFTNDPTALTRDVPLNSDGLGNLESNINLTFAASFNSTVTGSVLCTFAPVLDGPLQPQSGSPSVLPFTGGNQQTIIDTSNLFTVPVPVTKSGFTTTAVPMPFINMSGVKGLRLLTIQVTNITGQVTFYGIFRNGFNH